MERYVVFHEGIQGVQMSELGIATAATGKILLAVVSHLNEGNIEDAVALFADPFSFNDHVTKVLTVSIGPSAQLPRQLQVPGPRPR